MTWAKVRLALALAAFAGWLGYLGYAALTKSHEPRVSIAAIAAAKLQVIADVTAGPDGKPAAHVKGVVLGDNKDFEGDIVNLAPAHGFTGPGKYLLLLEPFGKDYRLVLPPRSPGYERPLSDIPTIYPWLPDVQAQMAKLKP